MTADVAAEHVNEAEEERFPAAPACAPKDRRRPGRMEHVPPALIELLRFHPDADVQRNEDREAENALGCARAIMVAALPALLTWVGLIWLIEELLR